MDYKPPPKNNTSSVFVVIKGSEPEKLAKCSPFAKVKVIESVVGSVLSIKTLKSNDLLVECKDIKQSTKLINGLTTFLHLEVSCSYHKTLNTSKGIIRCRELQYTKLDEIKEELRPKGVTDVYRVTHKREGKEFPSNTYILSFDKAQPPESISIMYQRYPVSLFVPSPLRCFKCQKFGHGSKTCPNCQVCSKCGNSDHDSNNCKEHPKCVNCDKSHPSFARECEVYKKEMAIQKIKITNRIPYFEAKRRYEASVPCPPVAGVSYASAAQKFTPELLVKQVESLPTIEIHQLATALLNILKELKSSPKSKTETGKSPALTVEALPDPPAPSSQPSKTVKAGEKGNKGPKGLLPTPMDTETSKKRPEDGKPGKRGSSNPSTNGSPPRKIPLVR